MDLKKVKRQHLKKNRLVKDIQISIRVDKNLSKWLRDQDLSPTGIFMEAVKELGYKDG